MIKRVYMFYCSVYNDKASVTNPTLIIIKTNITHNKSIYVNSEWAEREEVPVGAMIVHRWVYFVSKFSFFFVFIYAFVSRDDDNPSSQLIQIYSVDWTDVYDTYNIEHRTEPVSH